MSITAAACPSCVLGATSTSLLSLAYHTIETINVTVNTYITAYENGARSTSYESITQTLTDVIGSGSGKNASKTYTNLNDITWTVGDATLTYPTTYVQYLGFQGAPAASETCADPAEASSVSLPASTECAPFIYPLTEVTGATALPAAMLEYLGELAPVAAQFDGLPLTGCAPLDYTPASADTVPSSSSYASSAPISSAPIPSETHAPLSSSGVVNNGSKGNFTFTGPVRPNPTRLTPGQPLPSSYPARSSAPGPYRGSAQPVPSSAAYTTQPEISHTTAFVIQTLTGRTIVTTKKGGQDSGPHRKFHLRCVSCSFQATRC